jgi:protein O-GlcNAc transferase
MELEFTSTSNGKFIMSREDQVLKLKKLANDFLQNNHPADARNLLILACEQDSMDAEAWFLLGMTNNRLGFIDEAVHCFQKATTIQPEQPEIHYNLAKTYELQGDIDAALQGFREVLRLKPDFVVAYSKLGTLQESQGELEKALENYLEAARLEPHRADAHYNVGRLLKEMRRYEEAVTSYQAAIKLKPDFVQAIYGLGTVYHLLGDAKGAMEMYKKAILLQQDHLGAYIGLGNALKELGFIDHAIECYQHISALKPDLPGAYHNLGVMLKSQGKLESAEEMIKKELQLQPDSTEAQIVLAQIRVAQGRVRESIEPLEKLLALKPDDVVVASALLFSMHYLPEYSSEDLAATTAKCVARFNLREQFISPPINYPVPRRRLRIGYVSGDLYNHPVGYFIETVLAHHDKSHYEIFCYYNHNKYDDLTARLQNSAHHWRRIAGRSDSEVAQLMREDGIDLLIDLSGQTGRNRLGVFALKPSPVQITWLGYFATTGLNAMDYIIADRYVVPPDEERHYTEKVVRLPNTYLCFSPPDSEMESGDLPASATGNITFASFNNNAKLTEEVIACWSRILRAIPRAQLYLKYPPFGDANVQERYRNLFANRGIDSGRIIFSGSSPREELLATYREVDIALDPYPYTGGTTTLEALWMGIPVISLRGDRFLGRIGESILANIGLTECVADSEDAYIAKAIALASDLPRLAELRSSLRSRLLNSPLCDGPGFTRDLEAAYRRMWEAWCETQSEPAKD